MTRTRPAGLAVQPSWVVVPPHARLSAEAFGVRHRVLRIILWLQFPVLALMARLNDWPASAGAGTDRTSPAAVTVVQLMMLAMFCCAVGSLLIHSRRTGAAVVSLGLLLSSASIVSIGHGRSDLHFSFFVIIGLISLYQDWLPLLMSVVLVTTHHLALGLVAPATLYSDPRAQAAPMLFAFLYAGFILCSCAVQVVYWRFGYRAQEENDRVRADTEQALRRNAERFEALVQDSSDVISVIDDQGRIVSASAAVQRVMGYRPADLIDTHYRALIHPDDLSRLLADPELGSGEHRVEVRVRHADGTWHWHDLTMRDLSDNPAVGGRVINHRDVTERRMYQEKLVYEASHDALTGLANRVELLRTLEQELTASETGLAVLYLDLDGFKQVNDTHGHETGDALLVAVARRLRRCVLGSDQVGRLGGDEFAVILTQITSVDDAVAVARRILVELNQPVIVGGKMVSAGASIGIALAERGALKTDELLHRADTAMYHSKRDEKNSWRLYVEGMHDPSTTAMTLEDDLRHAVDDGRLRLQYQPVIDLRSGELIGLEALVRWQHPVKGLLEPDEFMALAEESQLVDRIGQWVLTTACRQTRRWQHRLGPDLQLSLGVNLSPRQLEAPSLVPGVLAVLGQTGYQPSDLVIEVPETAVVHASEAIAQLARLQESGVRIALDDFGTGYSSLRHLTRLPVDILKLDECFVAELNGTPQGSAVAEAVIRLGRILHLDTIAEGVENEAQATELTLLGCRAGQGFHYAPPLDPEEIDALLDRTPAGHRPQPGGVTDPVR